MIFKKKKFYTLLEIKNQIVYTPIFFVLITAILSFLLVFIFFSYEEKNKIDLLNQKHSFYKQNALKDYIQDVKYNTSASFDNKELELRNIVFEFLGYLNFYKEQNNNLKLNDLKKYIKVLEKKHNLELLIFHRKKYEVIYGKELFEYLRELTASKSKSSRFSNRMLQNIEYIGDDNLMYWTDKNKKDIRISYFKFIPNTDWIIASFSQTEDLQKITKKVIIDSLSSKSKSLQDAHFIFYDVDNKDLYNYFGKSLNIKIDSLKGKANLENFKFFYTFPKYHYKVYLKDKTKTKQIKQIKLEYDNKLIISSFLIVFISIFLILVSNIFGKYINSIFNRYNHRLQRRKSLYKKWKDRYELAIIASNDGLWDINLDNEKIYFSNKWLEVFSYNENEIKSIQDWINIIHKDDRSLVLNKFNEHLANKSEHFICEYRLKTKDGKYKWLLVRGKAFKTQTSNRMLMMSMDIDKKVRLSEELSNVESLTEFGRIVIFRWKNDENLSVKFVSDSITSYSYEAKDFIENKISYYDFVYKDDLQTFKLKIKNAIEKKQDSFTIIHRVINKKQEIKWVYNRTIVLKDDDSNIIGFYGYINDITKIKMNEEELKQKVQNELEKNIEKDRLLAQQNKLASMGEMLGNIAHQWRQPLNNINLLIHFIRDNYDNLPKELLNKSVKNVEVQVNYMSQTIDDFRNFYKPTKEKKIFVIKNSINRASKILASNFENNNINLEIIGEDIEIHNYENEFEQVIVNILSNACDAAIVKKEIEDFKAFVKIRIIKEDDNINVYLENNCGNVSEEILTKMFEPYFTTKFENQGTGIGLYMSKVIIERNMNGKIEVINKNDGLEFKIILTP